MAAGMFAIATVVTTGPPYIVVVVMVNACKIEIIILR